MPEIVDFSWIDDHKDDLDLVIADPRPPVKYLQGHIPNAVNLSSSKLFDRTTLELLPVERLAEIIGNNGIGIENTVLVYDDRDGQNMALLAWTLELLGHSKVRILSRFMEGWTQDQRPITYKRVEPSPRTIHANPIQHVRATVQEVSNEHELKLVDVRSREEYEGKSTDQRQVPKHLPGAINLPWTSLLGEGDQVFRPREELEKIVSEHQLDHKNRIVTYCSFGPRAALGYIALQQLGFRDVRVYDRSFQQSPKPMAFSLDDCLKVV